MAVKYIFVTGGVVSGLGKGITAASLGRLLKQRGLKVKLQKFDPYLGGIMDNLSILLSNSKKNKSKNSSSSSTSGKKLAQAYMNNGTITLQLIGHLRGRSITDTIFIIDEAQNIEPSVIKSIVTRAGKGSKFVFLGDPTQIDNPELNERYNGLVYLSEKMKGNPLCWQATLEDEESVRSALAFIAAQIL